jgi:polyisoprenoid-binding protein YceI
MKKFILFIYSAWLSSALATVLVPMKESKVYLSIPYTMGTHELEGKDFLGSAHLDESNLQMSEGRFSLAVDRITGQKKTLLCHMKEALTLDYEKSDFPEEHICEDDKLPSEGKNAPVYPEIEVQQLKPISIDGTTMTVKWTIHGVSREQVIPVSIRWDKQSRKLTVKSNFSIDRKEYDITVKKFFFVGVDEKIPLKLDLVLGEK